MGIFSSLHVYAVQWTDNTVEFGTVRFLLWQTHIHNLKYKIPITMSNKMLKYRQHGVHSQLNSAQWKIFWNNLIWLYAVCTEQGTYNVCWLTDWLSERENASDFSSNTNVNFGLTTGNCLCMYTRTIAYALTHVYINKKKRRTLMYIIFNVEHSTSHKNKRMPTMNDIKEKENQILCFNLNII